MYATEDQQENAKELIQTSLNDWLESSEEAVRSKNQQVEDNREKQMESLLEEVKYLSSRVEKIEKFKKKELDAVPSNSSKSKVLSSTTFKSELKEKVRSTLGVESDSDSSRPTSPSGTTTDSGQPSPREKVYARPSSLDKSKRIVSFERPESDGKLSSILSEISAPGTPMEAEFAGSLEMSDDLLDEQDHITEPKTSKFATESSEIVSPKSKIPTTSPPSPPPPPKNAKLPPPRNLIY